MAVVEVNTVQESSFCTNKNDSKQHTMSLKDMGIVKSLDKARLGMGEEKNRKPVTTSANAISDPNY